MFVLCFALLHSPRMPPECHALAYLCREVPAWSKEHKCFSCHNNGDAACALLTAVRVGFKIPDTALDDTAHWLTSPQNWAKNDPDAKYADKQLDTLQFGVALLEAMDAGKFKERDPLDKAAELVAALQHRDGYWPIGPNGTLGSPVTHGATLATVDARRILQRANAAKYKQAIKNADQWLREKQPKTVVDAAALLLALDKGEDDDSAKRRKECLAILRKGEAKDAGWGPYVNAAPEVFDTALVTVALSRQPRSEEIRTWLKRGRAYLLSKQQKDGSWPETTRPSGAESYAQRLSTTAWATQALLATR
ncbi:MAG TPA: hypothetical protein VGG61_16065 [Gemmataceae bacterium]